MVFGVYTIKDIKSGYTGLILEQNDRVAMRNFEHQFSDPHSLYYTHADDFSLVKLGEYDSETGVITPYPQTAYKLLLEGYGARMAMEDDYHEV